MIPKCSLRSRSSYSCFSNFFLTTSLVFWALTSITPTVFFRGAIHLKQSESVEDLHGLCLLSLLSGAYTELPQVCLPRAKQELSVSLMLYLPALFKNEASGVACSASTYTAQREGCWKRQYKCIAACPRSIITGGKSQTIGATRTGFVRWNKSMNNYCSGSQQHSYEGETGSTR